MAGPLNYYGDGTNSSVGANTIPHYYDRAGIKAANRVNVYQQFASKKWMPKKYGKTFKISKFLHIYDREPNGTDFDKYGYLTHRDIDTLSAFLKATDGTGAGLGEGAGAQNQRVLKKITVETTLARYGEMIDYTDEVELFSEDYLQVRYREELGELANSRFEDLIQLDMLATPTKMYAGPATSQVTLGDGITADGSDDDIYKVSYDLIRRAVRKLVQNRAKKNKEIVVGSTKIDTKPLAKAYYAIIGANVKGDLENLTRGTGAEAEFVFVPVHKYASIDSIAEGEVGSMHEVRFIEAEAALVDEGKGAAIPASYTGTLANDGTNFHVYPILFPTQDAFATVGLKGQGKIKFTAKAPSDIERSNPYGTNGFFAYNFFYAGLILEEEKLLRVDVLASE
jgi:N4-gp56 family major capsid protein